MIEREMGELSARMAVLEKTVEDLNEKVGEIRDVMMMGKGISRIAAYAGAILLVVIGAVVGQLVGWLWPVR